MTQENKGFEAFKKAADEIKPTPKNSSWDRLETMLDNKSLTQENKSYKNLIQWICGSAAVILLLAGGLFYLSVNENIESKQQFAYQTESLQSFEETNTQLYDIEKLAKLNDPNIWTNVVEGGPKIQVKKVFDN